MFNHHNQGPVMQTHTKEGLLKYTNTEVISLLNAYSEYKILSSQIASGITPKPVVKFTLMGNMGKMQNLDPFAEARKKLEAIGESMKFQNPLIWIEYKRLAYKNEPEKVIVTLSDLVAHCKVDGICHKRFDSMSAYLRKKYGGLDLTSQEFLDHMTNLEQVSQDPRYIAMCLDQEFQDVWSKNENDSRGKWHDYVLAPLDHDCESNCNC